VSVLGTVLVGTAAITKGSALPENRSVRVPATAAGVLLALGRFLGSSSRLSLTVGSNANLAIEGIGLKAAAPLGAGATQDAVVREEAGGRAVEYIISIVGQEAKPAAPTLTATGGDRLVHLAIAYGSNGGAPVQLVRIYRGTAADFAIGDATLVATLDGSPADYVDEGRTNGTTYHYSAVAVNAIGPSDAAAKVDAQPSAVTAPLNPLHWGVAGGQTFELSAVNRTIGVPQNRSAGTTLSIVKVERYLSPTLGSGTTEANRLDALPARLQAVDTNMVAISADGQALVTGVVPFPASALINEPYHVTVRERHPDGRQRDTVLPVLVRSLPKPSMWIEENFDSYPVGTLLRDIPGWTVLDANANPVSTDTTYQDAAYIVEAANQLGAVSRKLRIDQYASTSRKLFVRSLGSLDGEISFVFQGTPAGAETTQNNYLYFRFNGPSASYGYLAFRNDGAACSLRSRANAQSTTPGNTTPIAQISTSGANRWLPGDVITVRWIGSEAWVFRNGVLCALSGPGVKADLRTYDISGVAKIDRVGFATDLSVGSFELIDDLRMRALVGFSVSDPQRVYAYDWETGTACVPLCGGLTENIMALDWRLWNADLGAAVPGFDWANLDATISGVQQIGDLKYRTFSKKVVLPKPGGIHNYRIDVRDPVSQAVVSSIPFGIGLVTWWWGQSNNAHATMSDPTNGAGFLLTGDRDLDVNRKAWIIPADNGPDAVPTSPRGKPVAGYIDWLMNRFQVPVSVVAAAFGGHSLEDLSPGSLSRATTTWDVNSQTGVGKATPGHVSFDQCVFAAYQHASRLSNATLDQGEADSGSMDPANMTKGKPYPDYYRDGWVANHAALARHFGQRQQDIAMGIALTGMNPGAIAAGTTNQAKLLVLRQTQTAIASALVALGVPALVSHHKLDINFDPADLLHQSMPHQYQKLAPRHADALARMKGLIAFDRRGPIVTSFVRISDTVFEVGFDMNGATGLRADTGGHKVWSLVDAAGNADPTSYFAAGLTRVELSDTLPVEVIGNKIRLNLKTAHPGRIALLYGVGLRQYGAAWGIDAVNPFDMPTAPNGQSAPGQTRGTGYADDQKAGTGLNLDAQTTGTIGILPMMTALAA
jgi:hypothetical protein